MYIEYTKISNEKRLEYSFVDYIIIENNLFTKILLCIKLFLQHILHGIVTCEEQL